MRRLTVMNYKGGTGKTCTVVNLAHGLALAGKKVLIIDTDPQGSAGYHLGVNPQKTLYDFLIDNRSLDECKVVARENLDILCSNEHVFPAEIQLARRQNRELVLSEKMKDVTAYDVVIIDCAPSMNIMNQNAMLYSEELIIPVSMEYLSLVGVKQLLKNIKIINRIFKREIRICKVVPTFYDKRNKKSEDILNSLRRVFPQQIGSVIHSCVALSESPGAKNTIFEFDSKSKGAEDYTQLVKEVLKYGKEAI